MKRTGGARVVRGKFYARVRLGDGKRVQAALTGCATEDAASARAGDIAEIAQRLVEAGRGIDVQDYADRLGAATTEKEIRVIKLAVGLHADRVGAPMTGGYTFAQLAARWTSGELAKEFPDHVRVKDHARDIGMLTNAINPLAGPIPLVAFTLDDADRVMAACPAVAGSAARRHVAQVIHRVLALAAYPAKIIKVSPLPKGWLPKLGPPKAKSYLYPDEDRRLLRHKDIPIGYRLLFGFLDREGCRASEAIALEWADLDLRRGGVNLDENKTDDPRAWALDSGVTRALRWWKDNGAPTRGPFFDLTANHLADRLRLDLQAAGVERESLFENGPRRRHIVAHDLRGTFVTLSLANGKTETWVQDRTGHASTLMIARYRRTARTAAELRIGNLSPLDRTVPEIRGGARVGHTKTSRTGKKDAK